MRLRDMKSENQQDVQVRARGVRRLKRRWYPGKALEEESPICLQQEGGAPAPRELLFVLQAWDLTWHLREVSPGLQAELSSPAFVCPAPQE